MFLTPRKPCRGDRDDEDAVCCNMTFTAKPLFKICLVLFLFVLQFIVQGVYFERMAVRRAAGGMTTTTTTNTDAVTVELAHLPIAVENSKNYIERLDVDGCRFTTIYDDNGSRFYVRSGHSYVSQSPQWRNVAKKLDGSWDAHEVDDYLKIRRSEQRQEERIYQHLPSVRGNMTFVHIGKAGGSTINCALRAGSTHHCESEDLKGTSRPIPDSAISHHVSCSTHWSEWLKCYSIENLSYLVNVRNPLDRIASWFYYEHSENHDVVYNDRPHHCGQLILNSCFRNWEDLVTIGLSGPRPSITQPLRIGWDLSPLECSHWAWAAVQGTIPADYHNAFNYDWYAHFMFKDEETTRPKDVYVLRVEHLEQDWTTLDKLLGGTGVYPSVLKEDKNKAENKPLHVTKSNATIITDIGNRNLCRALCDEIQIYKRILLRAKNLNARDLDESVKELQKRCPEEVDIQPRTCHYD